MISDAHCVLFWWLPIGYVQPFIAVFLFLVLASNVRSWTLDSLGRADKVQCHQKIQISHWWCEERQGTGNVSHGALAEHNYHWRFLWNDDDIMCSQLLFRAELSCARLVPSQVSSPGWDTRSLSRWCGHTRPPLGGWVCTIETIF